MRCRAKREKANATQHLTLVRTCGHRKRAMVQDLRPFTRYQMQERLFEYDNFRHRRDSHARFCCFFFAKCNDGEKSILFLHIGLVVVHFSSISNATIPAKNDSCSIQRLLLLKSSEKRKALRYACQGSDGRAKIKMHYDNHQVNILQRLYPCFAHCKLPETAASTAHLNLEPTRWSPTSGPTADPRNRIFFAIFVKIVGKPAPKIRASGRARHNICRAD